MSTTMPSGDAQLGKRDVKALTEPMMVVEDHPDVWSDAEVVVYNEDREYTVNLALGFCDCADHHYRGADCKHMRRAGYALGQLEVPSWVDVESIDRPLRERLEVADE